MPLDVDALTALSDLAAIAESGVDARSLDDVVVPAWVSAPYDEHLTQPLLRPEAPELAAPPAPLGLPLSEPRFAVPAPGLAVLVEGEPEPLHLDHLPLDPDAPAAPDWPQHVRAGWLAALGAVSTLAARVAAATARGGARLRVVDVRRHAGTAVTALLALVRDVAADLRDTGPRLGRLAAVTAGTALLAAVLTPVLAPERPDGLSALSVLASASPLSFDAEPGSLPASTAPAPQRSAGAAPADAPAPAVPAPSDGGTDAGGAAEPAAPAEAGSQVGPLDVLRAGLPFGQESTPAPQPRAVAAGATATALPARSGTGRRLVIGAERAWAVAADGAVVRTWPLVRGRCLAPGTYRVRDGASSTAGARAVVWAGRDGARARPVHGVGAGAPPCGAAAPAAARWALTWAPPGSVVVVLP